MVDRMMSADLRGAIVLDHDRVDIIYAENFSFIHTNLARTYNLTLAVIHAVQSAQGGDAGVALQSHDSKAFVFKRQIGVGSGQNCNLAPLESGSC
jgi:hypothetical protein